MLRGIVEFVKEERGQDVIEYALLLSFVSLAGAAMFLSVGNLTSGLWSVVNSRMAAANQTS
jgi:Flp pilus assembly pilin Flp